MIPDAAHPGYKAAHDYIKRVKGKASAHPCASCGGPARQWARDNEAPVDTRDPDHYTAMCVSCHTVYDNTWRHVQNVLSGVHRGHPNRWCRYCARAVRLRLAPDGWTDLI